MAMRLMDKKIANGRITSLIKLLFNNIGIHCVGNVPVWIRKGGIALICGYAYIHGQSTSDNRPGCNFYSIKKKLSDLSTSISDIADDNDFSADSFKKNIFKEEYEKIFQSKELVKLGI